MVSVLFTRTVSHDKLRRAARTTLIGAILLTMPLSTAACQKRNLPSVPSIAGFRYDNGSLRVWTGTPCANVTEVTVGFKAKPKDSALGDDFEAHRLILTAPEPGVPVEYLDLDDIDPAFRIKQPLPNGFDWRTAEVVSVMVSTDIPTWDSSVLIEDVIAGSPTHDTDTYLFESVGWMNPADIAEGNGKDFITICTPDPAKDDE